MVIDRASIFADRFKGNPQILQAAVLGQSPVPGLDPYTALRAMQLLKESQQMQMAQAAQQPTQSPSLVQTAMQMPQMPPQMARPAPQQAAPQQAPMMAASGGLAAMHVPDEDYAEGGIVAFAGDGEEGQVTNSNPLLEALEAMEGSPGSPVTYQQLSSLYPGLIRQIMAEAPKGMTATERAQFVKDYIAERRAEAGASPFAALREEIATARGERDKNLRQAQGMALLEASAAALQPGGTMRGLAGAAAKFGGSYGQALQADRAERRALANMEMNIADAERKERMGLHSEARAAAAAADKDRVEASRAHTSKMTTLANLVGRGMQATKPTTPKPPAPPKWAEQLAAAEIAFEQNPTEENAQRVTALRRTAEKVRFSTSEVGPERARLGEAGIQTNIDTRVSAALEDWKASVAAKEYRKLLRTDPTAAAKLLQNEEKAIRARFTALAANPNAAPAAAPATSARPAPPAGFVEDTNR